MGKDCENMIWKTTEFEGGWLVYQQSLGQWRNSTAAWKQWPAVCNQSTICTVELGFLESMQLYWILALGTYNLHPRHGMLLLCHVGSPKKTCFCYSSLMVKSGWNQHYSRMDLENDERMQLFVQIKIDKHMIQHLTHERTKTFLYISWLPKFNLDKLILGVFFLSSRATPKNESPWPIWWPSEASPTRHGSLALTGLMRQLGEPPKEMELYPTQWLSS